MTKEELEKEAEEKYCKGCKWRIEQCLWAWRKTNGLKEPNEKNCSCKEVPAYLAGAEPREKRIAELEKKNKVLTQNLEDTEIINAELKEQIKHLETSVSNLRKDNKELQKVLPKLDKENDELKYKISLLLSCKDCPENKGGLICSKEYNDKCLAQNLEDTEIINKALEQENAELKGLKDVATLIRANNDTVVTLMQLNNKLVSKSQQLTKAKELLKRYVPYRQITNSIAYKDLADETEQFLNSEVEKCGQ